MGLAGVVTLLVLYRVAPGSRYRGVVLAGSCVWAVVPDFHHVLGAFPALQASWKAFHGSTLANVFWLHRAIDLADRGDSAALSLGMAVALLVVLVGTELALRRRGTGTAAPE
jgi:hypothetical protein